MSNKKQIITPEEHARLLAAGSKMLGIKPHEVSDLERLILTAQQKIKVVRDYATMLDNEVRAAGKNHNLKMLQEELQKRYLDAFMVYSKDDLLIMLSFFFTQQTIKEIV